MMLMMKQQALKILKLGEQYVKLPWPDEVATYLKVAIIQKGNDDADDEAAAIENLKIRKTIVRYCLLSYVLCLRRLSSLVRDHYPNMDSLIRTGLLRQDEKDIIGEEVIAEVYRHGCSNWWIPIKWSIDIIKQAQVQ